MKKASCYVIKMQRNVAEPRGIDVEMVTQTLRRMYDVLREDFGIRVSGGDMLTGSLTTVGSRGDMAGVSFDTLRRAYHKNPDLLTGMVAKLFLMEYIGDGNIAEFAAAYVVNRVNGMPVDNRSVARTLIDSVVSRLDDLQDSYNTLVVRPDPKIDSGKLVGILDQTAVLGSALIMVDILIRSDIKLGDLISDRRDSFTEAGKLYSDSEDRIITQNLGRFQARFLGRTDDTDIIFNNSLEYFVDLASEIGRLAQVFRRSIDNLGTKRGS